MKRLIASLFMLTLLLWTGPALAASTVSVTIPSFAVSLNEMKFDNNDFERYPLLLYKDITYFPMTYYQSNLLNLNTNWTAESGLVITKGDPEAPKAFSRETSVTKRNSKTQTATVVDSKVTVNGKVIDNANERYPLLLFRDVTYFPMTWRFAVDEFGWKYTFDNTNGLNIVADNFIYTPIQEGTNIIRSDGTYISVYSETRYIKGDLRIALITDFDRMGPFRENLSIIKNSAETKPKGYFGYYAGQAPLFTVDGDYINTVYYETDIPEIRNPRPCGVSIKDGKIY
jgi:hypothetical protein